MSRRGTSTRMKEQILRLQEQKYSRRKISQMLGISRNTVRKVLNKKEDLAQGSQELSQKPKRWMDQLSWDSILLEYNKKNVTIKQLAREYAPQVDYTCFLRIFHQKVPQVQTQEVSLIRHYDPACRVEVDYADGLFITDPKTGKQRKTQLFCGVLSFSQKTFGEFTLSQKQHDFLGSQTRMWHFFGGVSQYVIIDNLKSGVTKAHRYDPEVNAIYCDYAHHMGFAVLPARPRTPKDKASVEATIGIIQRQFYSEYRNRTFYSLDELNRCFRTYLTRLNSEKMKDYGVSRDERFVEEKLHLKPLPESSFEITEYRISKVHPDCHIQLDHNFYSVPYSYIGQIVQVKVCSKLIEVFNEDFKSIAVHLKKEGKGNFSTDERHYPEQKLAIARFDLIYAKKEAKKIGPSTAALVDQLLSGAMPLQYLRRVQGILRLVHSEYVSAEALEYGCKQALIFNRTRLQYVKNCALSFDRLGKRPTMVAPIRDAQSIHLHQPLTSK